MQTVSYIARDVVIGDGMIEQVFIHASVTV